MPNQYFRTTGYPYYYYYIIIVVVVLIITINYYHHNQLFFVQKIKDVNFITKFEVSLLQE